MRRFEVPLGLEILGVTKFNLKTVVATNQGVFIVTEDNVWLKIKPSLGYGDSERVDL